MIIINNFKKDNLLETPHDLFDKANGDNYHIIDKRFIIEIIEEIQLVWFSHKQNIID